MQPFKRNHLQHALAVSTWMREHGAVGGLDPRNLVMEITLNDKTVRFFPQFTATDDSGVCFVNQLVPGVTGYVGWYPYLAKGWPIAQDKLAFKRFANAAGLRTPAWSQDTQEVKGPFLVKSQRSSLGKGQQGPFQVQPPPSPAINISLQDGEYCEQFIMGKLLKAWYWKDQLAVVEVVDMPSVTGDGKSSVTTLYQQLTRSLDSHLFEPLLALQGGTASDVPQSGQKVIVDYQFMAESNPALMADYNCREHIRGTPFEAQLQQAGHICWEEVPEDKRGIGAFTTLDGIVDANGRVWFLEANCNPGLHPAAYDLMLRAVFGIS